MDDQILAHATTTIQKTLQKPITNYELLILYWQLGKILLENPKTNLSWLERKLKQTFGVTVSFSKRNFSCMKRFAETYSKEKLVQIQEVPWMILFKLVKNKVEVKTVITYCQSPTSDEFLQFIKNYHCSKKCLTENYLLMEICELQRNTLGKNQIML